MKVLTVVGTRPQFIKAAPVSRALQQAGHKEIFVHTGQHYDRLMSDIFFENLGKVSETVNLNIGSGTHGDQTGRMLIELERVMLTHRPEWVLVFGDTNSTLAGALAACKLGMPLAHIEAGLRSYNRCMPEEHNRVLTDHCADIHFCPTPTAAKNLVKEGIIRRVYLVGDTMFDAIRRFSGLAQQQSDILVRFGLTPRNYLLATLHRPYNVDIPEKLRAILQGLIEIGEVVILPVHPRATQLVRAIYDSLGRCLFDSKIRLVDPVGYLDMLMLQKNARLIFTDSGDVQKEAFFSGVPCVTIRPETEWVELLQMNVNMLTEADPADIVRAYHAMVDRPIDSSNKIFGDGRASEKIVSVLTGENI